MSNEVRLITVCISKITLTKKHKVRYICTYMWTNKIYQSLYDKQKLLNVSCSLNILF